MPLCAAACVWGILGLCESWAWIAQVLLGTWMLVGRSLRDAVKPVAKESRPQDRPPYLGLTRN